MHYLLRETGPEAGAAERVRDVGSAAHDFCRPLFPEVGAAANHNNFSAASSAAPALAALIAASVDPGPAAPVPDQQTTQAPAPAALSQ